MYLIDVDPRDILDLLRTLEWVEGACPCCHGLRPQHELSCRVAWTIQTLGGRRGVASPPER